MRQRKGSNTPVNLAVEKPSTKIAASAKIEVRPIRIINATRTQYIKLISARPPRFNSACRSFPTAQRPAAPGPLRRRQVLSQPGTQPERLHSANGPRASTKPAPAMSTAPHLALPPKTSSPATSIATPQQTPSTRLHLLMAAPFCPLRSYRFSGFITSQTERTREISQNRRSFGN